MLATFFFLITRLVLTYFTINHCDMHTKYGTGSHRGNICHKCTPAKSWRCQGSKKVSSDSFFFACSDTPPCGFWVCGYGEHSIHKWWLDDSSPFYCIAHATMQQESSKWEWWGKEREREKKQKKRRQKGREKKHMMTTLLHILHQWEKRNERWDPKEKWQEKNTERNMTR